MTFEEFFSKKRIDLIQLTKADPELVSEFKSHFVQMGEKSFDHSKKFWFNKLRKQFHLKEEPKPVKEAVAKAPVASQAEPLSSPTIEQKPAVVSANPASPAKPAFKPRSNPKNIPAKTTEQADETPAAEESLKEKLTSPVVKPKFTPRNIPLKKEAESELPSGNSPEVSQDKPKTAYKPRFNPKNIPVKAVEEKAEAPVHQEP